MYGEITYMTPFESLMNDLNAMVNSIVFSTKDKKKLAVVFRTCRSEEDVYDFHHKVKNIYLKRLGLN